jgi:hypothetical protein
MVTNVNLDNTNVNYDKCRGVPFSFVVQITVLIMLIALCRVATFVDDVTNRAISRASVYIDISLTSSNRSWLIDDELNARPVRCGNRVSMVNWKQLKCGIVVHGDETCRHRAKYV